MGAVVSQGCISLPAPHDGKGGGDGGRGGGVQRVGGGLKYLPRVGLDGGGGGRGHKIS